MRNNRTAGHDYERKIVLEINKLGPYKVGTSRLHSRYYDNQGIDIIDHPDEGFEDFPFFIQCKNYSTKVDYVSLFKDFKLEKQKPLAIFHKATKKEKVKFKTEGEFVILKKQDFYDLINQLNDKNRE